MDNNIFETQTLKPGSDINPQNPFENFTEYEAYNSDYREIVPQIDIPGCKIPFEPSKAERRRIRHYFNIAGGGIILHFLLSNGLLLAAVYILRLIVMRIDGVKPVEATRQYLSGLETFFNTSAINIGLNMLILTSCSIVIFLLGSKVSNIKIKSYFSAADFNVKTIAAYCVISFFIRYIAGIAGSAAEMIFSGVDMSAGTEMMNYENPKTIAITAVYACIGAPVTEELMYRGFVMKNLSRVGQRFGIIMSSLLFGLMHANVGQFIFAFIMGIFFAHIDVKHNSIIPSIIIHSFANTYSTVISYSGVLENQLALALTSLATLALSIAGFALFIKFYKNNRLPFTMPHQKLRNGTAVSSVMLIIPVVIYTFFTIYNSFPKLAEYLQI